ncbi:GNAT family N-acetyltransferase [Corynebacterium endometrii]|uniref:N-acyltransferase YncA n=1 Tax=Corynebacterium endometrii TaxID=2488819 RepID=A0A4P7QEX3_9CORY|nr:GNAT family N-acetyltransferase [Corynebacterium endometrii]QCB28053.1 N-acyltransferase YncA [Corynebacterium endometrii]
MPEVIIRPATHADAPAMAEIYNWGSGQPDSNLVTWEVDAQERVEWMDSLAKDGYPVFVAEQADADGDKGKILGFAAYFQFVTPAIYYGTAEDTIYISPDAQGKGVGSLLMEAVIDHAAGNDYVQTMITYIVDTNAASLALHKKFDFVETGRMPNIHTKQGKRLGLVHLQRDFPRHAL